MSSQLDTTLKAILDRRSVRKYKQDVVPKETFEKILYYATLAPSAMGKNPWQYHVVSGAALKQITAETGKVNYDAPYVVFLTVVGGIPGYEDYDSALATQNLCIAAAHYGLGSVILAYNYPKDTRDVIRKVLKIDEKVYLCPMGIALGFPEQVPPTPTRTPTVIYHQAINSDVAGHSDEAAASS